MNPIVMQAPKPDYFVAQFPGGGARGYATTLLLEWLENQTDFPTHQILPYATAGSVGILIAAALYLPHPEHSDAARMSAKQLAEVFPKIAAHLPRNIAIFRNKNDKKPFEEAIELLIGDARLKDFLGTVSFSCHEIGGIDDSFITYEKIINPTTSEVTYSQDKDTRVLDIALEGTALSVIFTPHGNRMDLAFTQGPQTFMLKISRLFNQHANGAFVNIGNFKKDFHDGAKHFYQGGLFGQIKSGAIIEEIDCGNHSQTLNFAHELFKGLVIDLEQKVGRDAIDPPEFAANIATLDQFEKIRKMTRAFIDENQDTLLYLAYNLKRIAHQRLRTHPETFLGIPPEIQEFPLPDIPPILEKRGKIEATVSLFSYGAHLAADFVKQFNNAAIETGRYMYPKASALLQNLSRTSFSQAAGKKTNFIIQLSLSRFRDFVETCLPKRGNEKYDKPQNSKDWAP